MNEDNKIFKTNEFSIEVSPVENTKQVKNVQYFSYDENSGLQLIHILMDGKPLDLPNGTEIRLSAVKLNNQNQKLIYTPEIVDPLNGIVSFVIPREFLGYQGRIRCGLYINFSNNQTMHVGYFYINMGVSDIDTNLTEFTEDFWQGWSEFEASSTAKMQELEAVLDAEAKRLTEHANQKITEYDQYIASGKSDWEDFVNQNREIIESVDPGGVILGELIDSRGDFTNLADRLNKKDELLSNLSFGKNFIFDEKFGVSAHRGSTSTAPENTLKSIREAARLGYELVEIDVQLTSDNELILMHDATVDRTTNGTGDVKDLTLEQIKSLVVDIDFAGKNTDESIKIPTFEEAVSLCSRLGLGINIDCSKKIWDVETFGLMVDIINKHNMMKRVFFVITDEAQRMTLLNEYPFIAITWLNNSLANLTNNIDFCRKYTNAFVSYPTSLITEIAIAELRKNNIPIHIYGTSTFNDIFKWQGKGIRFVETDNFIGLGD